MPTGLLQEHVTVFKLSLVHTPVEVSFTHLVLTSGSGVGGSLGEPQHFSTSSARRLPTGLAAKASANSFTGTKRYGLLAFAQYCPWSFLDVTCTASMHGQSQPVAALANCALCTVQSTWPALRRTAQAASGAWRHEAWCLPPAGSRRCPCAAAA